MTKDAERLAREIARLVGRDGATPSDKQLALIAVIAALGPVDYRLQEILVPTGHKS